MIGLGSLGSNALALTAEAKIQAEVAKFLAAKATIVNLVTKGSTTQIRGEANLLLEQQRTLEKELQSALSIIEQVKSGAYVMSDIVTVGAFAYSLQQHIKKVKDLDERNMHTNATKPSDPFGISPTMMTVGAVAAVAGILLYSMEKGK